MKKSTSQQLLLLVLFQFVSLTIQAQCSLLVSEPDKISFADNFDDIAKSKKCWGDYVDYRAVWMKQVSETEKALYVKEIENNKLARHDKGGAYAIFPDFQYQASKRAGASSHQDLSLDIKGDGAKGRDYFGLEVDYSFNCTLYFLMNEKGSFTIVKTKTDVYKKNEYSVAGIDYKNEAETIVPETTIEGFNKGEYNTLSISNKGDNIIVQINGKQVYTGKQPEGEIRYRLYTDVDKSFFVDNVKWTGYGKAQCSGTSYPVRDDKHRFGFCMDTSERYFQQNHEGTVFKDFYILTNAQKSKSMWLIPVRFNGIDTAQFENEVFAEITKRAPHITKSPYSEVRKEAKYAGCNWDATIHTYYNKFNGKDEDFFNFTYLKTGTDRLDGICLFTFNITAMEALSGGLWASAVACGIFVY